MDKKMTKGRKGGTPGGPKKGKRFERRRKRKVSVSWKRKKHGDLWNRRRKKRKKESGEGNAKGALRGRRLCRRKRILGVSNPDERDGEKKREIAFKSFVADCREVMGKLRTEEGRARGGRLACYAFDGEKGRRKTQ